MAYQLHGRHIACRRILIVSGLTFLACLDTAAADERPDLAPLLRAREEGVKSFEAEVVIVSRPGPERTAYSNARLRFADWIDQNRPELKTKSLRDDVALMKLDGPVVTTKYRYAVNSSGQIRIERINSPATGAGPAPEAKQTHIYNGNQWRSYTEGRDGRTGEVVSGLIIRQQEHKYGWFEIARGAAAEFHPLMTTDAIGFDLERRSTDVQAVGWSDLLRNIPSDRSKFELTEPPGSQEKRPSLMLETRSLNTGGQGVYRLQIWFEPRHSYAPFAMQCSLLQPAREAGEQNFQPHSAVHWSEPDKLPDGGTFFKKCLFQFYDQVPEPVEGRPDTQWPQPAFDVQHYEFQFENVKVNAPLNLAMFDIAPIAGTHVIDEQKGFTFILGKAGEELEKTAIAERDKMAGAHEPVAGLGRWRWWLVVVNVAVIVALVAYRLLVRKRSGGEA